MTRLSPSKIAVLFRCPREYAFKYLMEIKEKKSKALLWGSAFHAVLDGKEPDFSELETIDREYPWRAATRRMIAGYREATKDLPPTLCREMVHESEEVKIIADEIRATPDGKWWLTENKTASRIDEAKRLLLPNEIQMICYTAHTEENAALAWSDPSLFQGVIYTTTLKPMERRTKKDASVDEFGERMTSSTVVWKFSADLFKKSKRRWENLKDFADRRVEEVHSVFDAEKSVDNLPCNTASCMRFMSPCPYYSHCHGELNDVD